MSTKLSDKQESEVYRLTDEIANILSNLSFHLHPENILEEEKKFFDDSSYQPQFSYPQNRVYEIPTDQLAKLTKQLDAANLPEDLRAYVQNLIDYIPSRINYINNFGKTSYQQRFADECYQWDYHSGLLNLDKYIKDLLVNSVEIDYESDADSEILTDEQIVDYFNQIFLRSKKFANWKALSSNMRPRGIVVSQKNKQVLVGAKIKKTNLDMQRLVEHEIMVHVIRGINTSKQRLSILRESLSPGHILVEEGLAVYRESALGLLPKKTVYLYLARAEAASLSLTNDFRSVYNKIFANYRQHLSKQQVFTTVARSKRGLRDTSRFGAYPKDSAYLLGYIEILKYIRSGGDIYMLYSAKIGLNDLVLVKYNLIQKKHEE